MYNEYEIRPMPLSVKPCRMRVERFLNENGLRLDEVEYYACVFKQGNDEEILAGGGLYHDIIKCVAVNDKMRDEGFSSRLVSHLISEASSQGYDSVKVFTKPENLHIFEGLGFRQIANAPKAILMENGHGLRNYCNFLSNRRRYGKSGVIVMNANPFTLGHRYLIEQAAKQVDWLHVIVVKEDSRPWRESYKTLSNSLPPQTEDSRPWRESYKTLSNSLPPQTEEKSEFPYEERLEMVRKGTEKIMNVMVCEGSSYAVSAATFPTYFLKELNDASDTQICLDLDLFVHFIAPHLGVNIRFIGSEPTDSLTNRYNQLMHQILPSYGYKVIEIPRLEYHQWRQSKETSSVSLPPATKDYISASTVRKLLHKGNLKQAAALVPESTIPFLIAAQAYMALKAELNTTPKPGLVDKADNGAHKDMDYPLMLKSINVLRPFFRKIAELRVTGDMESTVSSLQKIGLEAEQAMLDATNGVNTHKGALFSLGITAFAAMSLLHNEQDITASALQKTITSIAALFPVPKGTHGSKVNEELKKSVSGALDNAQQGYPMLFGDWLQLYRGLHGDNYQNHKTLLHIMSMLDDTNIYYRKGAETAQKVKEEAKKLEEEFSIKKLQYMNEWFITENISPGGSADMLALTIFINYLISTETITGAG